MFFVRQIHPMPKFVPSLPSIQPVHSKLILKKISQPTDQYERKWKCKHQCFRPQKCILNFHPYWKEGILAWKKCEKPKPFELFHFQPCYGSITTQKSFIRLNPTRRFMKTFPDCTEKILDKKFENFHFLKITSKTPIFNVPLRLLKKRSKSCFSCDKSIQCPSLCPHYPRSTLCTPNASWKKFESPRSNMRESGNVNINAFELKNAYSVFIHTGKKAF